MYKPGCILITLYTPYSYLLTLVSRDQTAFFVFIWGGGSHQEGYSWDATPTFNIEMLLVWPSGPHREFRRPGACTQWKWGFKESITTSYLWAIMIVSYCAKHNARGSGVMPFRKTNALRLHFRFTMHVHINLMSQIKNHIEVTIHQH